MDAEPLGDWYIHDSSVGLRRSGGWLLTVGLILAGAGVCVLLMAATTWSGYVPQAALAIAGGLGIAAFGWSQLRDADRHRPRLVAVPLGMPTVAPQARPTQPRPTRPRPAEGRRPRVRQQPVHVMAWIETPRALPAAGRSAHPSNG